MCVRVSVRVLLACISVSVHGSVNAHVSLCACMCLGICVHTFSVWHNLCALIFYVYMSVYTHPSMHVYCCL